MLLFLSSKEQVLCLARAGKGGRGVLQRGAPAEPALLGAVGSGCWDGAGAPHPFPKRLAAGSSDAWHPLRSFVSSWLVLDGMQLAGWFCCGVREGRGWERGASPPGSAPHRGEQKQLCAPLRGPDGAALPPLPLFCCVFGPASQGKITPGVDLGTGMVG